MNHFSQHAENQWEERIKNSTSNALDLRNTGLFSQHIKALIAPLNQHSKITSLILSRTNIDDSCAQSLSKLQHVTYLDVSSTDIGDEGAKLLIANSSIKQIVLDETQITNSIASYIVNKATQTYLSVVGTQVDKKNMKAIEKKVSKNRDIETPSLPNGVHISCSGSNLI